jgi:hypothetical protein
MSNEVVKKLLWWLCLVAAPLVLIALELFHPASFTHHPGMYQYLSKSEPYDPQFKTLAYSGPGWWFTLHMIQTPMIGLVAVGLWLLVGGINHVDGAVAFAVAWLSRVATFVFLIYYTALDSIGGSGLARTILNTESLAINGHLTQEQVDGIALLLNTTWTDQWVGGVGSFISETGSWAAFAAALFAAVALFGARRVPWPPLLLLVGFGWELQTSHASPHGPIAFSLLIASAVWIRWVDGTRDKKMP